MTRVKYRRFGRYAGPLIRGKVPFKPDPSDHWSRVVWLASRVETGAKFGTIVMYDGTGVTAGLLQQVAVYPRYVATWSRRPRAGQGSLWELLEAMFEKAPGTTARLREELETCGWSVRQGLLMGDDGRPVPPPRIITEFTPPRGNVPRWGVEWHEAKGWALLFHEAFSAPDTYDVQVEEAFKLLLPSVRKKRRTLLGKSLEEAIYGGDLSKQADWLRPDDPLDLALAVLFSHSVNAPAIAFRKLAGIATLLEHSDLRDPADRERIARVLIRLLAVSSYGRWNYQIRNGRYQRTRRAAKKVWNSQNLVVPSTVLS